MDAHWFRWHHGTTTDPKWSVIARRASHATSRQVTRANVIAVWACILECASQSTTRGSLDGWCDEDVAAGIDLDEGVVAAICAAMRGKVLADDGKSLLSWEKRQPKREREDATAAERKRAQRERDSVGRGVTGCDEGASRQVTPRGEERREEEKEASGSVDPPSQETSRASGRDDGQGNPDFTVDDDDLAAQIVAERTSSEFKTAKRYVDPAAKLDDDQLAKFLIHIRSGKRGFVQTTVWLRELSTSINRLAKAGHDVNEAIRQTIAAGNLTRLVEPKSRDGPGPTRSGGGRVAENYEGVDYSR